MSGKGKPDLEICPRCHERSYFYNSYESKWECLNPRCWKYSGSRVQFDVPLWLVNIFESRHLFSFLICLGVLLWAYLATRFTNDNPISIALGIAITIVAVISLRLLLKAFIPSYRRQLRSGRFSHHLYTFLHSKFVRLLLILTIIGLFLWASYVAYILISFNTAHFWLNVILFIMLIVFVVWAVNVYRNSRVLAYKPRFVPVFSMLLVIAVVLSFLNVYPFSIPTYAISTFFTY